MYKTLEMLYVKCFKDELCGVYVCFQRITGSTLGHNLKMFGQSLSSGIDIDDNGYQGNSISHASFTYLLSVASYRVSLLSVELFYTR